MTDDLKVGDKYLVTIETEVIAGFGGRLFFSGAGGAIDIHSDKIVNTEKMVEEFGPGDVVKHRHAGNVYTILPDNRLFSHKDSKVLEMTADWTERFMTSEHHEKLA